LAAQPEHETISVRRIVFSPFAEVVGWIGSASHRRGVVVNPVKLRLGLNRNAVATFSPGLAAAATLGTGE
jgi:hypothetical protein